MINSSLKIASVSLPVVWADKKTNIDAVSDIMAGKPQGKGLGGV